MDLDGESPDAPCRWVLEAPGSMQLLSQAVTTWNSYESISAMGWIGLLQNSGVANVMVLRSGVFFFIVFLRNRVFKAQLTYKGSFLMNRIKDIIKEA